jgi:long-subunit acyl-CoA synthetase (AMP-forming)
MKQFDNENGRKIQELQIAAQGIIGEKDEIEGNITLQKGLLTQAEQSRDDAYKTGDKKGFEAAMDQVASVRKVIEGLEKKRKNHNTKAKLSAIVEQVSLINKSFTPMQQECEREIEIQRNKSMELEGQKGQVLSFFAELNKKISQL